MFNIRGKVLLLFRVSWSTLKGVQGFPEGSWVVLGSLVCFLEAVGLLGRRVYRFGVLG